MAGIDYKIGVEWGYRPCFVCGEKALFHQWVDRPKGSEHIIGLVEIEGGVMWEVHSREIQFCDNLISKYAFPEKQEDK